MRDEQLLERGGISGHAALGGGGSAREVQVDEREVVARGERRAAAEQVVREHGERVDVGGAA